VRDLSCDPEILRVIRPGTVPMLEIVIAIIAAASISIFLVHAVEAYLTQ